MPYLIGIDEAGYGPNLGPLVITATAWHVPDDVHGTELYRVLSAAVSPDLRTANGRLAITDSKQLYRSGNGMASLEKGVLAAIAQCGNVPACWTHIWDALGADPRGVRSGLPWYRDYDRTLPAAVDTAVLRVVVETMRATLAERQIRLAAVESRALFPADVNDAIRHFGTKAEALSRATLQLAADVHARCRGEPTEIHCDKHGGRNRYLRHLQASFPDRLIDVQKESQAVSRYRFGARNDRVEFVFRARGEAFLPTALASMTSKYVRELAMEALNVFWRRHVRTLRPTAGYPLDARRFKRTIARCQRELRIDDDILWRTR